MICVRYYFKSLIFKSNYEWWMMNSQVEPFIAPKKSHSSHSSFTIEKLKNPEHLCQSISYGFLPSFDPSDEFAMKKPNHKLLNNKAINLRWICDEFAMKKPNRKLLKNKVINLRWILRWICDEFAMIFESTIFATHWN
jgi:hypothetical protein